MTLELESLLSEKEWSASVRQRLRDLPNLYYTPQVSERSELKAWPTPYKGFNFRSRMEARWAVLLDLLGIEAVYEMEKLDIDVGVNIPDFYLPRYSFWIEVGPGDMAIHEGKQEKATHLANSTGRPVLVTRGYPGSHERCPLVSGCTVVLPEPHKTNTETITKHFPDLRRFGILNGPEVEDAIWVANNYQFEAIRDLSE